jgi:hypothetical protein
MLDDEAYCTNFKSLAVSRCSLLRYDALGFDKWTTRVRCGLQVVVP